MFTKVHSRFKKHVDSYIMLLLFAGDIIALIGFLKVMRDIFTINNPLTHFGFISLGYLMMLIATEMGQNKVKKGRNYSNEHF